MRPPEPYHFRFGTPQLIPQKAILEEDNALAIPLESYQKSVRIFVSSPHSTRHSIMPTILQVSIGHWQLRDLIHCPYATGEVFVVNRRRVLRHNFNTSNDTTTTTVECELPFEPTSMTVSSGYLAAGGQSSQLDLRHCHIPSSSTTSTSTTTGDVIFKGNCGGSVNNALRIARDASQRLRLFVCNNDDTVKIFSVAIGALVGIVRCPVAINHCAISSDGHLLACVGDNRHTYIYQATPSGYRSVLVYTEASDAGMGCDWSPSGSLVAAASQDGMTCVWDHRTSQLVAKFNTQLACRNVRFSPAPLDVLAFSEHRGRVHIADSRMWPRKQVLHVSGTPELEPDISGIAFSPGGEVLYAGMEDSISAYYVDTGARRSFAMAEVC